MERLTNEPDSGNRREKFLRSRIIGWLLAFFEELETEAKEVLDNVNEITKAGIQFGGK